MKINCTNCELEINMNDRVYETINYEVHENMNQEEYGFVCPRCNKHLTITIIVETKED